MTTSARPVLLLALAAVLAALGLWLALGFGGVDGDELGATGARQHAARADRTGPSLDRADGATEEPAAGVPRLEGEQPGVVRSAIDALQARGRADGVWLEGRLVDANGGPHRDVAVRVTLLPEDDRPVASPPGAFGASSIPARATRRPILISSFLQADTTGSFRTNLLGALNFHGRTLTEAASVGLLVEAVTEPELGPRWGEVVLDLPEAFEVGQDVGDLHLVPPPVVVAGLVVDHRGEPVAGATVQLLGGTPDGPGPLAPASSRGGWDGGPDRPVNPTGHGFPRYPLQTTDVDGAFAFLGPAPDGPLFLRTRRDDHVQLGGATFRAGTSDHRLELFPRGHLALELASAPPVRDRATVQLRDAWGNRFDVEQLRDRRQVLRDLVPGTYDLTIRRASHDVPVVEVRGVVVPPGEVGRDPRLVELDPSAGFERVALEVVDEDGAPVTAYGVDLTVGATWRDLEVDAAGRLQVGRLPAAVEVAADGFTPTRLTLARDQDEARVVLRRGLAVTLELPEGLVLGDWEARSWTAEVRPLGGDPPHRTQRLTVGGMLWGGGPFSGRSTVDFEEFNDFDLDGPLIVGPELGDDPVTFAPRLPGPGAFEVELSASFRRDGARYEAAVAHLTLEAREDGQVVVLPVAPFDVQALVDVEYGDEAEL